MTSPGNIHRILEQLGVDPDFFNWQHLADCRNLDTNLFFDAYDGTAAQQVDELCARCPVTKECFLSGEKQKEVGVRGGFFLENGKVSKRKNSHKTPEMVKILAERIYG